jgi:glutamyl-tRNA reductase
LPLVLIGVNHRTTPVEVRERLALTPHHTVECVRSLHALDEVSECAILSTCNRTEVLAVRGEGCPEDPSGLLAALLDDPLDLSPYSYCHTDEDAVLHLFRVAAGLDSMILGEGQILGQVRSAMRQSDEAGGLGTVLTKLLQWSLAAGKRARAETRIGTGAVSVSSAAVELAKEIFGHLTGRTALILGAGETGELTLKLLSDAGVSSVVVTNRTYDRALRLSESLGGEAVRFDQLRDAMVRADIVIGSTGAPFPVVHADSVREVMRRRRQKPLFLIDIAVPRDIEPDVGLLDNVFLYNIDDLQAVVQQNLGDRHEEARKVEAILEEEAAGFLQWWQTLSLGPVLAGLQHRFEEIRVAELEKTMPRLSHLSEADREALELLTRGIVKRILKAPIAHLKSQAGEPSGAAYLEATRELFGLNGHCSRPRLAEESEDVLGDPREERDQ